jgi:hypothetical protein
MVTINLRFANIYAGVSLDDGGLSKKSHKIKITLRLRQWGDVAMWSTLFAFTFLIAVALSLAAIRLSL